MTAEQRRNRRRRIADGFPKESIFSTLEEVRAYLAGDRICCLLCGRWFKALTSHLMLHDTNAAEYKLRYGIPWTYGLDSAETNMLHADAQRAVDPNMLRSRAEVARASITGKRRLLSPPVIAQRSNRITSFVEIQSFQSCSGCGVEGESRKHTWLCEGCKKPRDPVARRLISQKHYYKDLEHSRSLLRERARRMRSKPA